MDEDDLEEYLEEYADLWRVDVDEVAALYEKVGDLDTWASVPLGENDRPDPDYMTDLAEAWGVDDVSDLYDWYYGYAELT